MGVDDADVAAVDQHQDGGSGVGSADADVVESACVAEGEFAVAVDDVAVNRPGFGGDIDPTERWSHVSTDEASARGS